jgi:hypothetical protein
MSSGTKRRMSYDVPYLVGAIGLICAKDDRA